MSVINRTMFPISTGAQNLTMLKSRFDLLQTQLATEQKAQTLSQMGSDRYLDLTLRSRLAKLEGYQANIKTVDLRLSVMDNVVSRLGKVQSEAKSAAASAGSGSGNIGYQTAPAVANTRLNEVLTLLNADVAGRYLFGGSRTDSKPVATPTEVMDGANGKAGFKTVAAERKAADLGDAAHPGRVSVSASGGSVTLARDGDHPFGLQLSTLSSSDGNIALTQPNGSPAQLAVGFNSGALPAVGSTVTVSFTLPDGSTEAVTLKAVAGTPGAGEFQIGADADATATNFSAALDGSICELRDTKLASASAFAAAENFFNGQGEPVLRVSGSPPETATSLVAASEADTVLWYKGEDNANPRGTVSAKVGEGSSVSYGAQANEAGFVDLIRALAATAVQTYSTADPTAAARYAATSSRSSDRLFDSAHASNGSIQVIAVELGLAKATTGAMTDRHNTHGAQLTNMLDDIERAPIEQVAMEILALKTRLEASYQTTSMLAQLSLVKYM